MNRRPNLRLVIANDRPAPRPRREPAAECCMPWATLALAGLMVALAATGPAAEPLAYHRAAVADGEVWRLVTGHLVHEERRALGASLAGLLLVGGIAEATLRLPAWRLLALLAAGLAAADLWLWFGAPELPHYQGLAGGIAALLTGALVAARRRSGRAWPLLAAALLPLKLAAEAALGVVLLPGPTAHYLPQAQAAGILGGAAAALWLTRPRVPRAIFA
ncbi:MAG TPA: rhomboid family intramembrane serine protease [Alphaproteobacteria bacterium]|nr:rhomboid family intramembrane serine protease [Alphaproteobacteria bacterium]